MILPNEPRMLLKTNKDRQTTGLPVPRTVQSRYLTAPGNEDRRHVVRVGRRQPAADCQSASCRHRHSQGMRNEPIGKGGLFSINSLRLFPDEPNAVEQSPGGPEARAFGVSC